MLQPRKQPSPGKQTTMNGENAGIATWKKVVVTRTVIENIDDATTMTTMKNEDLDPRGLLDETEVCLVTVILVADATKTTTGRTEMIGIIGIENAIVNVVRTVKRAETAIGTGSERRATDTGTMIGIVRGIPPLIRHDMAGIEIVTVTHIGEDSRPNEDGPLLFSPG